MSDARSDRRRTRIVDRPDQLRLVRFATYPMIAILVVVLFTQMLFDSQLQRLAVDRGVEITGLARRFASTLLFFVLATAWHVASSVRLSSHVSGAAHRVIKTLQEFREGNRSVRANLRDRDLHQNLAAEVNSFLDWAEPRLSAGQAAPASRGERTDRRPEEQGVETTVG